MNFQTQSMPGAVDKVIPITCFINDFPGGAINFLTG